MVLMDIYIVDTRYRSRKNDNRMPDNNQKPDTNSGILYFVNTSLFVSHSI
jgi:hypothetical protein